MFKIGDFSKISQVTPKMLKYYRQCGLLLPTYTDKESGYHYYEAAQLIRLARIRTLLDIGFTIEEIVGILKKGNIDEMISKKRQQLQNELSDIDRRCKLAVFYEELNKSHAFNQKYNAMIKLLPAVPFAAKKVRVENMLCLNEEFAELFDAVKRCGLTPTRNPNTMAMFMSSEYRDMANDVEMRIFIDDVGESDNSFEIKTLKESKVLSILHVGAYSLFKDAYSFAYSWIKANGYEAVGYPCEMYLSGQWDNGENESNYLTELIITIKKAEQ